MTEKQEDKIVLTLNDEPVSQVDTPLADEETKKVTVEDIEASKLDDSTLTEEEKKMVEDFAKQIDITKTNSILQYGAAAQNKVAEFSENTLKNVKAKDLGDVGETLSDLVDQLKNFNVNEKDGFFTKLFKKSANSIQGLKTKYDSATSPKSLALTFFNVFSENSATLF